MGPQAAYIVERFVSGWRRARAAGFGCYRGMVVARSRQHVAWYAMVGGAGQLLGGACMQQSAPQARRTVGFHCAGAAARGAMCCAGQDAVIHEGRACAVGLFWCVALAVVQGFLFMDNRLLLRHTQALRRVLERTPEFWELAGGCGVAGRGGTGKCA